MNEHEKEKIQQFIQDGPSKEYLDNLANFIDELMEIPGFNEVAVSSMSFVGFQDDSDPNSDGFRLDELIQVLHNAVRTQIVYSFAAAFYLARYLYTQQKKEMVN